MYLLFFESLYKNFDNFTVIKYNIYILFYLYFICYIYKQNSILNSVANYISYIKFYKIERKYSILNTKMI